MRSYVTRLGHSLVHPARSLILCSFAAVGCAFELTPPGGVSPDGGGDAPFVFDGPPPMLVVSHLDPPEATAGISDLVLGDATVIDTTTASITGQVLIAGSFAPVTHSGGGPMLAVLRVRSLTIPQNATVRVIGDRPLLVIAETDITISGILDGAARLGEPGPGGSVQSAARPGQGTAGANDGDIGDSGGSGGGFGTAGGTGGAAGHDYLTLQVPRTAGGPSHGDANVALLAGGGAGGVGSPCTVLGGAGGGAIQLSAFAAVHVAGTVHVGGGGGARGALCSTTGGSAGGGGSGGSIFIEAPRVEVSGTLAANGGSGGAGSDSPAGLQGVAGNNARPAAQVSSGAPRVGATNVGAKGGDGGWRDAPPTTGDDTTYGNGGGGGGAVGRIVLRAASLADTGSVASPMRTALTF